MASMLPLLFLLLIFASNLHNSNAFTLGKIFKDGMVLQAIPTTAKIWGNVDDGNTNPIRLDLTCSMSPDHTHAHATIQVRHTFKKYSKFSK